MYYANCEWYVDMGEHNKPLCERNSLRPAKCSECPVYIGSIEDENAKLRELVRVMAYCAYDEHSCDRCAMNGAEMHITVDRSLCCDGMLEKLIEVGIGVEDA